MSFPRAFINTGCFSLRENLSYKDKKQSIAQYKVSGLNIIGFLNQSLRTYRSRLTFMPSDIKPAQPRALIFTTRCHIGSWRTASSIFEKSREGAVAGKGQLAGYVRLAVPFGQ